jgi:hypothetical protein
LATNKTDPVALAKHHRPNRDSRVEFDAHAEVEFQCRSRQLKRSSNIVLIESMEKVVGRDGLLHDILVCLAFKQMLTLARGVLCTDLVAVDALNRQAFVLFFGSEFNEGSMDVVERWSRQVGTWGIVDLGGWFGLRSGSHGYGSAVGTYGTRHGRSADHVLYRSTLGSDAICDAGGVCVAICILEAIGAVRTRGVGLVLEARTLEQMLFLARCVLCSDLLAVDALDRQAFVVFCVETVWSANGYSHSMVPVTVGQVSFSNDGVLPLARNSTNAACTS